MLKISPIPLKQKMGVEKFLQYNLVLKQKLRLPIFGLGKLKNSLYLWKSCEMGYIQEAKENQMKKKVEEALRSKMKQKALKECAEYASKYAQCAAGRTISVVWHCRKQAKGLNECLHPYTNDKVLEEMKKEYMARQEGKGPVIV